MDEILAPILQGSPWAIVVVLGFVIRSLWLDSKTTHKDYSKEMKVVQDKRREEVVEMNEKLTTLAQGTAQTIEKLTSALTGLNGGR